MCAYKRAAEALILLTFFLLTVNPSFTLVPVTIKLKPEQVQADRDRQYAVQVVCWQVVQLLSGLCAVFLVVASHVGDHRA